MPTNLGIVKPSAKAVQALKALSFPIIDSHHHLWDVTGTTPRIQGAWASYDFKKHGFEAPKTPRVPKVAGAAEAMSEEDLTAMTGVILNTFGSTQAIFNNFLNEDLIAFAEEEAGVKLGASVYIECGWGIHEPNAQAQETKYIEDMSYKTTGGKISTGIVGHTDLFNNTLEATREEMKAHVAASAHFRGIRYQLAHPGERPGMMPSCPQEKIVHNENFLKNFAVLEEFNSTFEIWCYGHQLQDAIFLANKFPKTQFILDHFGTPIDIATKQEVWDAWVRDFTALSKCPNVVVKLSGLMVQLGFDFHKRYPCGSSPGPSAQEIAASRFGDMTRLAIKLFKAERCMWGSNFSVDWASARFGELLAAFVICCQEANMSQADLKKVFRENAIRVYSLKPTTSPNL
ncbi:hypothetical protein SmJEL517_g00140 [Synchytrium microbalum]|uniref:Amidohydrolase-related domain-containing protein n=1 Tax=Synchytrium microbalum TaxID=1806994 RepID=A0A507CK21_9FUNG|nr:uncharacterized protein SmJEL517_g00140 [Synchytrium microbalum]TPX38143.1 hypothetical protein SmJEL517_g00140 [Synchytrium microbalum]